LQHLLGHHALVGFGLSEILEAIKRKPKHCGADTTHILLKPSVGKCLIVADAWPKDGEIRSWRRVLANGSRPFVDDQRI
jgi:hypothetical protein